MVATVVPEPLLEPAALDVPVLPDELAAPEVLLLLISHAQVVTLQARPALVQGVQLHPEPPLLLAEGDTQVHAEGSQSNPELMHGEQSHAELAPPEVPDPTSQVQLTGLQPKPEFVHGEQSQLAVPELLEVVAVEPLAWVEVEVALVAEEVPAVLAEFPREEEDVPPVLVEAAVWPLLEVLVSPCDPLDPREAAPLVPDEEAVVPETEPLAVVTVPVPPAFVAPAAPPPPNRPPSMPQAVALGVWQIPVESQHPEQFEASHFELHPDQATAPARSKAPKPRRLTFMDGRYLRAPLSAGAGEWRESRVRRGMSSPSRFLRDEYP